MGRLAFIFAVFSLLFAGSASAQRLANIPTAYVPEANYKRFKCEDLFRERARAENDVASLFAQLQAYHSRYLIDFLALNLPLATMDGNTVAAETHLEHEISHAKGELEAISLASNRKHCQAPPILPPKTGDGFDVR